MLIIHINVECDIVGIPLSSTEVASHATAHAHTNFAYLNNSIAPLWNCIASEIWHQYYTFSD